MFNSFSLPTLIVIFGVASAIVWRAGTALSDTTDVLDKQFRLGEALGGVILLAIVTNLPEIAITVSAALSNNVELAVGNLLGGIAMQTVVLVLLDAVGIGKSTTLSAEQSSLTPVLEGILVLAMLALVVIGHQLPPGLTIARLSPTDLALVATWIAGVALISKAHKGLPWQLVKTSSPPAKDTSTKQSTARTVLVFAIAALATLAGGVALEESGDAMASKVGMDGVVFGATVLAAATSLPEVSTGLASIKIKDYTLAVSDIFGGNAFLPVLLVVATLLSGKPVLPTAQKSDLYLTGLAMLLTVVYLYGFLFRPKRQVANMGIDSLVVLLLYAIGAVGLFYLAK